MKEEVEENSEKLGIFGIAPRYRKCAMTKKALKRRHGTKDRAKSTRKGPRHLGTGIAPRIQISAKALEMRQDTEKAPRARGKRQGTGKASRDIKFSQQAQKLRLGSRNSPWHWKGANALEKRKGTRIASTNITLWTRQGTGTTST